MGALSYPQRMMKLKTYTGAELRELLRAELEAKTRYVRNMLTRYQRKDDQ